MAPGQKNKTFSLIKSDVVAIGVTVDEMRVDAVKPHCFCGVRFFADADGATEATPTEGTITLTIQTVNTEPRFEPPVATNIINAASPETIGWDGNTQAVKAVPSGIDVATHYQIVVTCNET